MISSLAKSRKGVRSLVRRMTRLLSNPCPLLLQTMATGATGGREVMEHGVEDVEETEVLSPRHRGVSYSFLFL